jgi:diketogulonate reductase-like aldo/keto reductase
MLLVVGHIQRVRLKLVVLQVDYIDVMLLHATDCEDDGGRLACTGTEKSSTRTWEDSWRELEITVDQGGANSQGSY